ncbi:MAG: OmpH family outer membrane protein, partial [Pseudomonadota bacterium]
VDTEFQRRLQALGEENQRLSAELEAEELRLTELRPTTDPTEFRAMADAFDEKVQALRAEQDAKEAELLEFNEQSQIQFQRQVLPIVTAILRERGAVLLIDRRSAVVVADAIDITDEAIERVNAALDATLPLGVPVPAPEAPPSVEGLPFGVPEVSPDPSASPGDAPGVGDDARP